MEWAVPVELIAERGGIIIEGDEARPCRWSDRILGAGVSAPKLQSCLGVRVGNSGPKKTVREDNFRETVGHIRFM